MLYPNGRLAQHVENLWKELRSHAPTSIAPSRGDRQATLLRHFLRGAQGGGGAGASKLDVPHVRSWSTGSHMNSDGGAEQPSPSS